MPGRARQAISCWITGSWKLYILPRKPPSRVGTPTEKFKVMVCVYEPCEKLGRLAGPLAERESNLKYLLRRGASSRRENGKGMDRVDFQILTSLLSQSSLPNSCIHHPSQFQIIKFLKTQDGGEEKSRYKQNTFLVEFI